MTRSDSESMAPPAVPPCSTRNSVPPHADSQPLTSDDRLSDDRLSDDGSGDDGSGDDGSGDDELGDGRLSDGRLDDDDVRSGLRPPQFRLRTLLVGIGVLCGLLAVAKLLSPAAVLVLIVLVLSIVAHVAGNALGTQLRDRGNRRLNGSLAPPSDQEAFASKSLAAEHFAPPSKLSSRYSLGLIVVPFIVVGSIGAAIGGGFWLANTVREKATVANMSLGIGAFAVIGGILGFLVGTFLKVMIAANVEAWDNQDAR